MKDRRPRPLNEREREVLTAITAGDLAGWSELCEQLPLARVRLSWVRQNRQASTSRFQAVLHGHRLLSPSYL